MIGPFEADDAATPLTPAEREGLIPTHVTLKGELNELEQKNITAANGWAFERKRNVLDEAFLRGLHRRMFNQVWRWAGNYRTTERNIGVAPHLIQPQLVQAIDDARFWVEHKSYEGALPKSWIEPKERSAAKATSRAICAPSRRAPRLARVRVR